MTFVCAGQSEQFDFAEPIGIGMVHAAIRLTQLCISQRPSELLFVGTAGSYGRHEVFDIVASSSATNIETGFLFNQSYTPISNRIQAAHDVSRETWVNSSNYITSDETVSARLLSRNIDLENMEFYSVMKVAEHFGIPAKGLFIVTNQCNKFAHRDFAAHRDEAMHRLTDYVRSIYGS